MCTVRIEQLARHNNYMSGEENWIAIGNLFLKKGRIATTSGESDKKIELTAY
jgi:hypothetical protein